MKDKSKNRRNATKSKNIKPLDKLSIFMGIGAIVAIPILLFFAFKPKSPPAMLSLKEYWAEMEAGAHSVQQDAKLSNLSIRLKRGAPYAIVAEYNSISIPDKVIFVGVEKNGEVSATLLDMKTNSNFIVTNEGIVAEKDKILRKDWAIDSIEALEIFSENETVRYCLENDSDSIDLQLIRDFDSVVWTLLLWECPDNEKSESFYMNALTGEIIDRYK